MGKSIREAVDLVLLWHGLLNVPLALNPDAQATTGWHDQPQVQPEYARSPANVRFDMRSRGESRKTSHRQS
jgi:hypothetical protein